VYHALLPPHVGMSTFIGNLLSLWVDGIYYDAGFLFAIIVCISLLFIASRMTRYVAERAFSWPVIVLGCIVFGFMGYFYEIHQTLSTGEARVPIL
jgi:phosphoglycerol transferase MdoB-like AlkP superfamily enzyme